MKVRRTDKDAFEIGLSGEELGILMNCINEALELGWEFPIRVGAEVKEAEAMWEAMSAAKETGD
jgi:hypothetical protein